MDSWSLLIESFFRADLVARFAPEIAKAMLVTIHLATLVVVSGILAGLTLAVIRSFEVRAVNYPIVIAVDALRAFPPLVLILLFYFGLPGLGIVLSAFQVLWLALGLVLAAFAEEIFWAGILSVRKGQWEAARSTSLSFGQTLAYIVLPQAVRLAIAPLTNRTIGITKNTALGGVIGVPEILSVASTGQSIIGNSTPLMLGALAYVLLFIPVVIASRWIETRFAWRRA
ncbi:MAG: amino acid ABC transporter permease [Betaproteobacteria bacterium]|nr:amino acid ABC transporter permease [Betaproteobacteria bacterium]